MKLWIWRSLVREYKNNKYSIFCIYCHKTLSERCILLLLKLDFLFLAKHFTEFILAKSSLFLYFQSLFASLSHKWLFNFSIFSIFSLNLKNNLYILDFHYSSIYNGTIETFLNLQGFKLMISQLFLKPEMRKALLKRKQK